MHYGYWYLPLWFNAKNLTLTCNKTVVIYALCASQLGKGFHKIYFAIKDIFLFNLAPVFEKDKEIKKVSNFAMKSKMHRDDDVKNEDDSEDFNTISEVNIQSWVSVYEYCMHNS